MKKLIILIALVAVGSFAWYSWQGSTIEYVAEFETVVEEIAAELASVEAEAAAGTLTPQAAVAVQTKIYNRIDEIETLLSDTGGKKLSEADRALLVDTLNRLKVVLNQYRDTLNTVEEAVATLPATEQPRRRGGGGRRLTDELSFIVAEAEEHVEEVVEDYEPTEDLLLEDEDQMATTSEDVSEDETDMSDDSDNEDDAVATDDTEEVDEGDVSGDDTDTITESETDEATSTEEVAEEPTN